MALLGISVPAFAQQPVPSANWKQQKIELTLKEQSLADAVAILREKIGRNILVDGEPIRPSTDLQIETTVAEALDRVADTFDYTWTVSKRGVILMTKRFKDPMERPQTNPAELKQVANEMVRLLEALPGNKTPSVDGFMLKSVAASLTPPQIQDLREGKRLRIGDLPAPQRDLAAQAIWCHLFLDTRWAWENMAVQLDTMPTAYFWTHSVQGLHPRTGEKIQKLFFHYFTQDKQGRGRGFSLDTDSPEEPKR